MSSSISQSTDSWRRTGDLQRHKHNLSMRIVPALALDCNTQQHTRRWWSHILQAATSLCIHSHTLHWEKAFHPGLTAESQMSVVASGSCKQWTQKIQDAVWPLQQHDAFSVAGQEAYHEGGGI